MAIAFKYLARAMTGAIEIVGRGIRAYDVLGYVSEGDTPQDIADNYELPLAAVYEALAYAEENSDEMAALRDREDKAYSAVMATMPVELREQVAAINATEKEHGRPLP